MRLATYVVTLALLVSTAWADSKPVPSGPLKAYKGPEGELIVMVEVNDSKEMLVYVNKVGGGIDGKTFLYLFEDQGRGNKNVYVNKKRGSKTYRSVLLTQRDGEWDFYHPTKPTVHFSLRYSEEQSDKIKVDEVLNAYKP